ncbi:hypothetical protein DHEL01_v206185 [Diaporthe helianthi]|uniref:Uncharacterized protein n=1 Tax=Diaporthe helianthi TaxID=158607 RepID=A0A2P5HYT2_DIAHE|nr:hypothetical protein DHEL01_v206185 [Diaporthe helianthi]
MSAINPLISNGTCYFAVGTKASSNIIPCGNSANGAQQCCQEGDFCLEYNVCFNAKYTTTYLAGCTDEEFISPNCPGKSASPQQLLNLVQCPDSETEDSVVWSTCSMPATRTEIGPPAACTCKDADDGILTGPKRFSEIASLPTAVGQTITFQPGHTPKTKGSSTTTVTSTASDGQLTTATQTVTEPPLAAPSTAAADSGLSKGTKAGIGVGVAVAASAIIALLAFLFIRHRRRHSKHQAAGKAAYEPAAPGPDMTQSPPPQYAGTMGSPRYYDASSSPRGDFSGSDGYPGYTGFKSELPAVPVGSSKPEPARVSELPAGASALSFSSGRGLDRNATPSLLSMPGSTGRLSMVSDLSRAPSVAPSMQSSQGDGYAKGPSAGNTGNMATIAELYG